MNLFQSDKLFLYKLRDIMSITFNQQAWKQNFFSYLDKESTNKEKVENLEFSWKEHSEEDFQNSLKKRNEEHTIFRAKAVLHQFLENVDHRGISIACTGSDGRNEKLNSSSSALELILVARVDANSETIRKTKEFVASHKGLFYEKLEVKVLSKDCLCCFDRNWGEKEQKDYRPFPTRALDANHLVGDEAIFREYQTKFYCELKESKSQKLLSKFRSSSVKPTLQLMKRSAEKKAVSDIDIAKGALIYDGNRIKATKYALLRPVQYKIAEHIWKLIREDKISEELFQTAPSSTIDRIGWLAKNRLISASQEQLSSIKKAYTAALIWSGIAQKEFECNSKKESFVSSKELEEVAGAISDFCLNEKIFSVGQKI